MNKTLFILAVIITFSFLSMGQEKNIETGGSDGKKTLRRENCFFGLHFDFHATSDDNRIGETFTYGMADSMLSIIKPDYIQVDCKGHPGVSSYPTKVGNPAPGFLKDPYKIWSEVTKKHNVGLFVHYSGVIDAEAVKKHPKWGIINAKGEPVPDKNSVKGPYVDKLLIPQIKELIDNYHINGAWIDGESWALEPDYSKYMTDAYTKETGIKDIPRFDTAAGFVDYKNFNRDAFRKYIKHYVDELHKYDPEFQVTSNWAFSSFMPQPVDADVDFISGDFDPNNSLYSGLYEARCIASQGKPWDLMVWSFTHNNEGAYVTKSTVQLQQSAAAVISMGGGFEIYSTQNRDASIKPWLWDMLKSTGNFCRARQPYCQYAKPVPQIAVLYSTANFLKNSKPLYNNSGRINDPVKGMMSLLLDYQNTVEILMEHHLEKRIDEYPLVVIPETQYLTDDFKKRLLEYVNNGGSLLIAGVEASAMFKDQLNVEFNGKPFESVRNIEWKGSIAGVKSLFQPVTLKTGAELYGITYSQPDFRFPSYPGATITSYGRGKIAAVYFSIGGDYMKMKNPVYGNFIDGIVRKLFPDPKVEVTGSENVIVTLNKPDDKLAVNLINFSGPHNNIRVARYDSIPAIGPLNVKIRVDKEPAKVTLQPENTPLQYTYKDGEINTTVEQVDIYSIIVVE
jgi:hypothetical protein